MQADAYEYILNPAPTQRGWRAGLWSALRATAYRICDDETLVRRAQAGDQGAFDALVARYHDRLYAMALASLQNEDRARDALRETILSAFRDIDSFNATCTPGTWMYLHGFRAVFSRVKVSDGTHAVENQNGHSVAS